MKQKVAHHATATEILPLKMLAYNQSPNRQAYYVTSLSGKTRMMKSIKIAELIDEDA